MASSSGTKARNHCFEQFITTRWRLPFKDSYQKTKQSTDSIQCNTNKKGVLCCWKEGFAIDVKGWVSFKRNAWVHHDDDTIMTSSHGHWLIQGNQSKERKARNVDQILWLRLIAVMLCSNGFLRRIRLSNNSYIFWWVEEAGTNEEHLSDDKLEEVNSGPRQQEWCTTLSSPREG